MEPVIPGGAVGTVGFMNDFLGDFQQFFIGGGFMEPFLHGRLIKLFEAFHSWAVGHHDNAFHDLFLVLSDIFESEEEQQFEVLEDIRLCAFHQFHVV